jgi:hypothetical protein
MRIALRQPHPIQEHRRPLGARPRAPPMGQLRQTTFSIALNSGNKWWNW